jgi:hypothetical protein
MTNSEPKIVAWSELHTARYTGSLKKVPEIKAWRTQELEAGRPSGLQDYWNAHGSDYCPECHSVGIAMIEREGLRAFKAVGWDGEIQLWEECSACSGTGRNGSAQSDSIDNQRDG